MALGPVVAAATVMTALMAGPWAAAGDHNNSGGAKTGETKTTTAPTKPGETTTTTTTKPTETTTTEAPSGRCTGVAYDLRLDVSGIATGFVGPVNSTEPDVFPDRETFSNVSVLFPFSGSTSPVLNAMTLDVENLGNPQDGCTTRATYENVTVDLDNITPAEGDIPISLNARVIETQARAAQNPDGTVDTSSRVTLIGARLTVGDETFSLPVGEVPPNTGLQQRCVEGAGGMLCAKVLLHETELIPGGISANAVRIRVELVTPLPEPNSQIIDLKLAHAEADVHAE